MHQWFGSVPIDSTHWARIPSLPSYKPKPPTPVAAETVQTKETPAVAPAATYSDSSECDCWQTMNVQLKEKGFKLSDKLLSCRMTPTALKVMVALPLERLDGKKLRAGDPKVALASNCPWCGRSVDGQNP
jgi:hypothetical protein